MRPGLFGLLPLQGRHPLTGRDPTGGKRHLWRMGATPVYITDFTDSSPWGASLLLPVVK